MSRGLGDVYKRQDIDNAQFNNVLFKEALENVKKIYISNGLSQ